MSEDKLIIGLTGSIGSGKSLVAKYFEELDVVVIDADQITREIMSPSSDLLKKIKNKFGETILKVDGSLNRKKLQKIIFEDKQRKEWLEALLHPLVCKIMIERAKQASSPYCVLVIPLLIELFVKAKLVDPTVKPRNDDIDRTPPYRLDQFIDRILVVTTDPLSQLKRIQNRDNLPSDEIMNIINAQTSQSEKLTYADDIIDNTSTLSYLKKQVQALHKQYLAKSMRDST